MNKIIVIKLAASSVLTSVISLFVMYFFPRNVISSCESSKDCINEAQLVYFGFPYPYKIGGLATQFFFSSLVIDFLIIALPIFGLLFLIYYLKQKKI